MKAVENEVHYAEIRACEETGCLGVCDGTHI